jgi:hypothetical protein
VTADRRNLLLLVLGDVSTERLREEIARRAQPTHVHVVAGALVGPLDWLATAEDEAYRQAEVRAFEVEWTLANEAEVEGGAGDSDPVQAVEDALSTFPAEEILVAGDQADADLEAELARFGLPVARLEQTAPRRRSRAYRAFRGLAAGKHEATPFILFVGVNGALFLLAILLSLIVILVLWLSGNL